MFPRLLHGNKIESRRFKIFFKSLTPTPLTSANVWNLSLLHKVHKKAQNFTMQTVVQFSMLGNYN